MTVVEIINYALRSVACLTFFYAFYLLLLNNETCFRFNRFYLIASLLLSFILPLISIPLSITNSSTIDPSALILPEVIIREEIIVNTSALQLVDYITGAYLVVAAILFLKLVASMLKVLMIIHNHRNAIVRDGRYLILNTAGSYPTSSFFNYIFWDETASLSKNERLQVLQHEKTHVNELHSVDLLLMEFTCALIWFNPLVWFIKQRIIENHEFIADHKANFEWSNYATLLAKFTLQQQGIMLSHPFKSHEVFKRLKMLRNAGKKTMPVKYISVLLLLSCMIFTMSFSIEKIAPISIDKSPSLIHNMDSEVNSSNADIQSNSVNQNYTPPNELKNELASSPEALNSLGVSDLKNLSPAFDNTAVIPSEVKEEVFTMVEKSARPKDGIEAFYKSIAKKLKYPRSARKQGIEGRVFIQFDVDKQGELANFNIVKGLHPDCDNAAKASLQNSPSWEPAQHNGKVVKQRIVLPITFSLSK